MTDHQTQIAIKILQYLADNNNYERDGNVYSYVCDWNTDDRTLEGDYEHVRDSLEKDYRLIRREKAELHLTPDGEAAQRIGFEKYLKQVKKGKQLELTLKRMEIVSKFLTIVKDSKTVLLLVAAAVGGIAHGIVNLMGFHVWPFVRRTAILLLERITTL